MPAKPPAAKAKPSDTPGRRPKKSRSLPALRPARGSPLSASQPLCAVQVRSRQYEVSAVGGGSVRRLSRRRLPFVAFERGLEWERSHMMATLPAEHLPPLQDVMRMAMKELRLPRTAEQRKRFDTGELPRRGSLPALPPPYLGGPRLPRRGRCIDDLVPRTPMTLVVSNAAEDRRTSVLAEVAAEGRALVLSPAAGGGGTPGEAAPRALDSSTPANTGGQITAIVEESIDETVLQFPWKEEELRTAFAKFDMDRDGELHTEELPLVLQYLGARPHPGDVEQIVKELTRFSTLNWEEVVDFVHRFRSLDCKRMNDVFLAADKDGSGELDFDELYLLLQELGYYPTAQSTLEAFEALDKDKSATITFREFEGLRDYLRVTEGFTKADFEELVMLHSKSTLAKPSLQGVAEEVWRITMYLGYSAPMKLIQDVCEQVNPDSSSGISATDLLKVVRLVRETEQADMIRTMANNGDNPACLPCERLGLALHELGYHVSEDAVNEILEELGECESEESLTLEELGAFLRAYRRTEGFTQAELGELKATFLQEGQMEEGALHTLEVGKVLRWFGFARSVQQVQRLVEEVDMDGSGVIEFSEFLKLMRRLYQEEAEHRQLIFEELATESATGVKEVHTTKFGDAVAMLADAEPDLAVVEAASKSLLAETGGAPRSFVSQLGFEGFFRHYRRLMIEDIRASAGYSLAEKAWFQEVFNEYDKDRSGTVEGGELMKLIAAYFPDATLSKQGQQDVRRALEEVDLDGNGELEFSEFLLLMRKCDDWRDARDRQMEVDVVRECGLTSDEVDGFRQIFSANVDWKGELDLATLADILGRVVNLSEDDVRNLSSLVCEVHPDHREAARFPQFLKLIKRLTEENYGHLNEQAARFLRRQQRLHQQRRVDHSD